MKHAQNECKRYNYVDVTPKPESRLLLWELLQCCVSNETTLGDGPASNTELCYIPKWFSFILNRVRTNEMKQKVVKRGGRSVTDRGPLGNCNRRRPCSKTCLLWFTCCAQLCTLVVKKKMHSATLVILKYQCQFCLVSHHLFAKVFWKRGSEFTAFWTSPAAGLFSRRILLLRSHVGLSSKRWQHDSEEIVVFVPTSLLQ